MNDFSTFNGICSRVPAISLGGVYPYKMTSRYQYQVLRPKFQDNIHVWRETLHHSFTKPFRYLCLSRLLFWMGDDICLTSPSHTAPVSKVNLDFKYHWISLSKKTHIELEHQKIKLQITRHQVIPVIPTDIHSLGVWFALSHQSHPGMTRCLGEDSGHFVTPTPTMHYVSGK